MILGGQEPETGDPSAAPGGDQSSRAPTTTPRQETRTRACSHRTTGPANEPLPAFHADRYPTTGPLGRCHDCKRLVFDHQPHEWADPDTRETCWPYDSHAALYCRRCLSRCRPGAP